MEEKITIQTEKAPQPIGPYSIGIALGNLIFTSGQLGVDPETGELVEGGIQAETRQALRNIAHILEAAGSSLEKVIKTTIYLRDMGEFAQMNAVYSEFFAKDPPARTTIQAAALPKNAAVEIEAIAHR
ncbi:MAG: RidA family protein [Anaerolineales bacterium]|nr:RidA family protein [Anaerolineales bacterium]MCS7246751.1 RidA family protein [Anaerolineales bacterium]MDW8160561.1 RidA family protein [Anaerolineales bacterium]MDW8447848.1 RidA family protein [Anaerolineales bacterium]